MATDRPEHLGPMARSLVETFAGLTLPQQRQVYKLLTEVLETNEDAERAYEMLRMQAAQQDAPASENDATGQP